MLAQMIEKQIIGMDYFSKKYKLWVERLMMVKNVLTLTKKSPIMSMAMEKNVMILVKNKNYIYNDVNMCNLYLNYVTNQ